jgi:hypothetical protein
VAGFWAFPTPVKKFLLATAIATASLLNASGQTILIDFGNNSSYRGYSQSGPDANGNYWTSVWSGAYFPNLLDTTGTATPVGLGFVTVGGTDSFNGPAGVTSNPATLSEVNSVTINTAALGVLGGSKAAAFDYYTNSTMAINALSANQAYEIRLFGSHKYNANNTTRYTLYTNNTFTTPISSQTLVVGVNGAHNESNFATFSNVAPQGTSIYIGFEGDGGTGNGYLNALAIIAVPEPSTWAMFGIGAVGVVLAGRRRCRRES